MKKFATIFLLLFSCLSSFGQTETNILQQTKIEGTYQIQVINTRDNPFIPQNIETIVIENRKKDVITYYKLSENVRIKILPLDYITSKEYKPLSLIEHIQE